MTERPKLRPVDLIMTVAKSLKDKGLCPVCHEKVTTFRDELSAKEYKISGLCQKCQDVVFSSKDD